MTSKNYENYLMKLKEKGINPGEPKLNQKGELDEDRVKIYEKVFSEKPSKSEKVKKSE